MDLQDRADDIALKAIAANKPRSLRLPNEGELEQRAAQCLEDLAKLFATELDCSKLAEYAATATYRANLHELELLELKKMLAKVLSAMDLVEVASQGDAADARAAFEKLRAEYKFESSFVDASHALGVKVRASAGGQKRMARQNATHAFAIRKYAERSWPTVAEAARQLAPVVRDYAMSLNWRMSGPNSLTRVKRWLYEYRKSTIS